MATRPRLSVRVAILLALLPLGLAIVTLLMVLAWAALALVMMIGGHNPFWID